MEELKRKIEEIIQPKIAEMDLFLVEVVIGSNFKIQVFVDGTPSITIEQCTKLSRFIESYLDEAADVPEKYTLEVSSPGMSNPFKVHQQYQKRIGSTLKLTLNDGSELAIILKEVEDDKITGLKTQIQPAKSKRPVKKIKEEDLESITIELNNIKKALLHFNF